jgi:hypothetical protein
MKGLLRRWARTVLPTSLRTRIRNTRARLRRPAMELWLKEHRPEIYRRITTSDLPVQLREAIFTSLAGDDYRRLPVWGARPNKFETDVLIVTPQFSPDMIKDVIALRSQRPGLHCTLLFGSQWLGQKHIAEREFDEIIEYGDAGIVKIIDVLNTASARTTIIRGARSHMDVVMELFSPGRIIFRSEEFNCSNPGYDPQSDAALAERHIIENVDGIYHVWGDEASETIRGMMKANGPIENIPSSMIDELGPHKHLPKLSATDGAMHMVFAGDTVEIDGEPEHIDKWKLLCSQGIHVHYYNPVPTWITLQRAEPYLELEKQTPLFHVEKTVDFEQALVDLTQYDWAYGHFVPVRCALNPGFEHIASNLMLTMVQAELPMMIRPNARLLFLDWIIDEHAVGFKIETDDLSTAEAKLRAGLTDEMPENFRRLKQELAFKREVLADLVLPSEEQQPSQSSQ